MYQRNVLIGCVFLAAVSAYADDPGPTVIYLTYQKPNPLDFIFQSGGPKGACRDNNHKQIIGYKGTMASSFVLTPGQDTACNTARLRCHDDPTSTCQIAFQIQPYSYCFPNANQTQLQNPSVSLVDPTSGILTIRYQVKIQNNVPSPADSYQVNSASAVGAQLCPVLDFRENNTKTSLKFVGCANDKDYINEINCCYSSDGAAHPDKCNWDST